MPKEKTFELGATENTDARQREVQLLINIAEPDPEYQPFLLTDEASLLEAVATGTDVIRSRLIAYFGDDMQLDLRQPVWQLVDQIRRLRPGWPDDYGAH